MKSKSLYPDPWYTSGRGNGDNDIETLIDKTPNRAVVITTTKRKFKFNGKKEALCIKQLRQLCNLLFLYVTLVVL